MSPFKFSGLVDTPCMPVALYAFTYCRAGYAKVTRDLRARYAINRYLIPRSTSIRALLNQCGPPAIVFRIALIVIAPVKLPPFGTRSHVVNKCLVVVPSSADTDAPPTIVCIGLMSRIIASSHHAFPDFSHSTLWYVNCSAKILPADGDCAFFCFIILW